ncbi:MAG: hypothetical protein LBH09_06050 [Peptococcaceae bacterium]|jgi:hypothetical protein|nr:hypothetical protein [Peptococcaceae bacterium]
MIHPDSTPSNPSVAIGDGSVPLGNLPKTGYDDPYTEREWAIWLAMISLAAIAGIIAKKKTAK